MSAQYLEQRARELLAAESRGRREADTMLGPDVASEAAIRAIVAALRQQPAPVDLEQFREAYAQGWAAAAAWAGERHLIFDVDSDAYTDERDSRLLSIIDNAGKVEVEPSAVRSLVAAANAVLALYPKMVDRFLCWKLPKDFGPDSGISFAPTHFQQGENADLHWPTGTNLLTAMQAKEMFSHCIAGALADIEEDAYVIHQLGKLLAEIAVIVNGPEPPLTKWSYHDLPEKVRALKDAARVAT